MLVFREREALLGGERERKLAATGKEREREVLLAMEMIELVVTGRQRWGRR